MIGIGQHLQLAATLGWQDVKQSYRRSSLGPFWLTLGMAIQILALGAVFGLIFQTPLDEFLPFIGTSLILWGFLSSSILDGSMTFVASEAILRQLPVPHYVHVLRSLWKNLIMLLHNFVLLPVIFILFSTSPTWNLTLLVPGFLLTLLFLFSFTFLLALVTTRFRDIQQITSSVMTVVFYVTPIIWQPTTIPGEIAHLLLGLNPFYHFLQIIRLPILGHAPTLENWAIAILITAVSALLAHIASEKFKHKLVYWV